MYVVGCLAGPSGSSAMVLGSPCSQELAAGAGSSRRRRGSFKQPCAARRSKPSARRRGSPSRAWQVFYGASSRGGADCCSPHFGAPIRCMCRASRVGVVEDQVGLLFLRGLAYLHARVGCVGGRKTRRSRASSVASVRRRHPALQEDQRTAHLQALQAQSIREQNPPGRATPWLRDSSASVSWAKAWPAAF